MPAKKSIRVTKAQQQIVKTPFDQTVFLEGAAGTGKTTVGTRRIRYMFEEKVAPDSILILVPQKALALPYYDELKRKKTAGSQVGVMTIGSLSQQMVDLFWPLVAEEAGFKHPMKRPHFLSLELVQYYMHKIIGPEIDRNGYFNSVTINRNRLFSQIVDNLNKASVVGIPYQEVGERLKSAWQGDETQKHVYDDAQRCMTRFREFCLENNLLDFSLQVHVFIDYLWPMEAPRHYLLNKFRHLIVDNSEEDNPVTHAMLGDWLPQCDSALIIYDTDAGYRRFLGADADDAYRLKAHCDTHAMLDRHFTMSDDMTAFAVEMAETLHHPLEGVKVKRKADALAAIEFPESIRYHPQMVDAVVERIAALIYDEGVPTSEIVVIAPFMSDALRFALMTRLEAYDVPARSHRPSRALREEPAALALMTLAKLAHPAWQMRPTTFDVAHALTTAISDLDMVRARLLVDVLYKKGQLAAFDNIRNAEIQQRITFELGERYDMLRQWIDEYQQEMSPQLDFFWSRLFGELLSRNGYGFHDDFDATRTAANLIDSARHFRQIIGSIDPDAPLAKDYVEMVQRGILADAYLDWQLEDTESVLLTPAYTFLMSNRAVDYQFWINVGSPGWATRLYQPLTHPYILSLQWEQGRKWGDEDELAANQDALYRLVLGLIRRCRERIYLGFSELGEQGYEQRGELLMAIQGMLRRRALEEA
ncbi:MAG: hypothetical protein D6737_06160 [Chloroflexi bacterium]|nr:MAG: hypothetical protein D6737_06160 [Chloroflexota bacterium]